MNEAIAKPKPKRRARKVNRPEAVKGKGGLKNITAQVGEVRVISADSIEQLVDEMERATEEGFERQGTAYFEGKENTPFRQAMVRHEPGTAPPPKSSVRKGQVTLS